MKVFGTFHPFNLRDQRHQGIGDVKIPDEVEQIDASDDGHVSSSEHIPAHEKDHKRSWIDVVKGDVLKNI